MNSEQPVLKARAIHKAFYNPCVVPILKGVDLTIMRGETLAIMGRSGEGKSTLLQILGTLENACSGYLEIANQTVTSFNKSKIRNKNLAFIFQSFHLLEDYTALENVLMPASIARNKISKGSPAYKRACELLEKVGLNSRMHFNTKLLSGGEKQRVAIARALCNDPDIIFADEPSGNLDKQTSQYIHELLLSFARNQNKTLVLVTHDTDLASMCNRRFRLCEGVLVAE
ncbi:MAG: ABC transporter ATP-binding protein [Parachlamydiaceae bacterium]|nr:ABC transporter ATP-binding protein [Parachlamydiaceae bacterium]